MLIFQTNGLEAHKFVRYIKYPSDEMKLTEMCS